jgi:hypothetical protein
MKSLSAVVVLAFISIVAAPAQAQPGRYSPVGSLNCTMSGGVGAIIVGVRELRCVFTPTLGPPENYVGRITNVGVDLGVTTGGIFNWTVLMAGATPYPPTALGGNYVGAGADASLVVGGGANILLGGNNHAFALQPLATQAQTGVNVSAGLTGFELRYMP